MMTLFRAISVYLAALLVTGLAQAATIYVDDDNATGPWNGTSANPYQYIQDGIDAAVDTDIVQVADGIYTGAGNVNLDFGGKAITVQSENGATNCVIDCEDAPGTRGFYFHSGEGTDSVVDGFTIQNGRGFPSGGGIYCDSASPTIRNNIVTGNQTDATWVAGSVTGGGGIYCADSSAVITNNIITRNECIAGTGGGICSGDSSLTIANNTITGNVSDWSSGGGIFCGHSMLIPGPHPEFHATITNTILWNNIPQEIYFSLFNEFSTVTVSYSDVQGGEAGMVINGPGTVNWLDGNIETHPRFADASSDDYHLEDNSPCIGAGAIGPGVPANDIEGTPRGTPPDMGAYENILDAPVPWTIHVATTGSDATGNGSEGNPYGTIQKGIDESFDSCIVQVADGTYTGTGNVNLDFGGKAITVRSENGAASCIIDCENVPDTRGFYFHSGEGADSILDGFTIRNGNANSGGGIYCMSPGPCPSSSVVTAPTIMNNIITGNEASYFGGGIACRSCSEPTITDNTITDNSASSGGGIAYVFASAVMSNNTVTGNSASGSGGGIYLEEYYSTIANNVITGNTADRGGGISSSWCNATIINNTIAGNSASNAGGFYLGNPSDLTITNTILWNTGPQEIGFDGSGFSTATISYSNIRGGQENIAPGDDMLNWLAGNIDTDPLFMDAVSDNYRLSNFSPCIGSGIMTPDVPSTDIEGNPRANPPGSDPDMGVYENGLDAPLAVTLISTYSQWESGVLTIEAETEDPHGLIVSVLFQYSLDGATWHDVGTDASSPYSVDWDTTSAIPEADDTVWVGATATDIADSAKQDVIDTSFGVDNRSPDTTDDYDGEWHNRNFTITLTGNDEDSGIASTNYRVNNGGARSVSQDGNPRITMEGAENELEYWSIDNVGNEEPHNTLYNIRLDKTSPITSDDYDGEWRNMDFVITLAANDELSGVADTDYRINGGVEMSVSEYGNPMMDVEGSNNQLEYWSTDEAGNEEERHLVPNIRLDKTPPATIDDYDGEWRNVDIIIALSGNDELSGLADIRYRINDGAELSVSENGNPIIDTEGSSNRLEYWGIDAIGNAEEHHIVSDIKLDKTPPVAGDDYDGKWHSEGFVITLTGDDEFSGIVSVNYRINDGAEKSVSTDGHPEIDREGGDNRLEYWGIDNASNEEEHHVVSDIKLDTTPPVTEDDYDGNWHSEDFIIALTGDDESSGLASISYRMNDGAEKSVSTDGHPEIDNEGDNNRLEYWGTDNAGNEEEHHIASGIKLDKTPPTTNDNYNGEWHDRDFTITLRGDDEFSEVESINYRVNNGTEKSVSRDGHPGIDTEGKDNRLEYWGVDKLGNEEKHNTLSRIKLDKTPPTTSDDYDGEWHRKDFLIALTGEDELSGIANIEYRMNNGRRMSVSRDGYPKISDQGGNNSLEYWGTDDADNEETHHILPNIKLDKMKPTLARWRYPAGLTQVYQGAFRVEVDVVDAGGSGLSGVLFDYHIGAGTGYSGYKTMVSVGDGAWYFDVIADWLQHAGEMLYYTVRASDVAGNISTSEEHTVLIQRKPPPIVDITSTYSQWENGVLSVEAEATDEDGTVVSVLFQYSLDGATWHNIGMDTTAPYSVEWDTISAIPITHDVILLRAIATDNDGLTGQDVIDTGFGVDNESPKTSDDYDGEWHREIYSITLTGDDASGSGVSGIRYRMNDGEERSVSLDGQPMIDAEGDDNQLEYWGIDNAGNEEEHHILPDVKLDMTGPTFSGWQHPAGMTQLHQGAFHVKVEVRDTGGSGMSGAPLFDYHIGNDTHYDGYEAMTDEGGGIWSFDIIADWSERPDQEIYYKAQTSDVAGNANTSSEFSMLIESRPPPLIDVTSTYSQWENGTLLVEAEATDEDGIVMSVLFQYSLDGATWHDIGMDTTAPYSVEWDTVSAIPTVHDGVLLKATATDNDGLTGQDVIDTGFGVDNELPKTNDDYDGKWHREIYSITLTGDDGSGSGVSDIRYRMNDGEARSISLDGQPMIDAEGDDSKLEYWGIDNAGNVEDHHILSDIKPVDSVPPVGSLVINEDAKYTNTRAVTLALSASDDGSGMGDGARMRFSSDNVAFTVAEPYKTIRGWPLPEGDGRSTVYVQFSDAIGNWTSMEIGATILLDTTPPVGSVVINNDDEYCRSAGVVLTISAVDGGSGIDQMMFSNDNITFSPPETYTDIKNWELTSGEGAKSVYVTLKDASGNWSASVVSDTITLYKSSLEIFDAVIIAGEDNPNINFSASFFDSPYTHTATIDWGDGSVPDSISPATSPFTASHEYPQDDGLYTVKVTVTDDGGDSMEDSFTVTIGNVPPVVDAGEDQTVNEGEVVFINAAFTDGGSADTHVAVIDWGDGVTEEGSTEVSPSHVTVTESEGSSTVTGGHIYSNDGIYTVTIMVTDDDEGSGSDNITINVGNSVPLIGKLMDQTVNEDNPDIGISVSFTDSGALDIHTATIDWGDGSEPDSVSPVTSPFTASHEYPKDDGSYTVRVTVTDDGGDSMEDSFIVAVDNVPPVVDAGEDQTAPQGEAVSINAAFTDGGLADTHVAVIDWGDGAVTKSAGSGPVTGSHIYSNDGVYTVTITVTDDDEGSGADHLVVSVIPPPNIASISPDAGSFEGGTQVTIIGENFQIGATVTIGNNPATNVDIVSETEITAITPAGLPGTANLVVANPDGQEGRAVSGFTYIGPVARLSISPQELVIQKGETYQFSVSGEDELGNLCQITITDLAWSVEDNSVGEIENGLFTAKGFGKTTVSVSMKEDASISAEAKIEAPDTEPPSVLTKQLFPNFGDQNVPVTAKIQIEFSEPINVEKAEMKVTGENGREVAGDRESDDEARTLTFAPAEPFKNEEAVTVIITTVEDLSGNTLSQEFQAGFTTGLGVWPGDTNSDGNVNARDIIPIGRYWHRTGNKRVGTTSDWTICPVAPWKQEKMATYADANGDGVVDEQDILPIVDYWRQSHSDKSAAPLLVVKECPAADEKMLSVYQTMYDVLEALPSENQGVQVLRLFLEEIVADIERDLMPGKSMLLQNYPNPFNPETWIPYQLAETAFASISIYDVNGRLVRTLDIGQKTAGYYLLKQEAAYWDGRNQFGEQVCSGVYFYHIRAGEFGNIRKLIISR